MLGIELGCLRRQSGNALRLPCQSDIVISNALSALALTAGLPVHGAWIQGETCHTPKILGKLDTVYRGKKTCRFVRAGTEAELTERTATYKRFRQLIDRWTELSIQRGMIDFFPAAKKSAKKKSAPSRRTKAKPRS